MFVDRFDGQWRLLLRALLSGVHGTHRALEVFHKQHRANPNTSLQHFVEALCQDEIACLESATQPLTVKPLVCLFPSLFKQNLLAFIYQLNHLLPQTTLRHVLDCIKLDTLPNTWIPSLIVQLERQFDIDHEKPLFSEDCGRRLMDLSQRVHCGSRGEGWACSFQGIPSPSCLEPSESSLSQVLPRKRKGSPGDKDSDNEEVCNQNKRMKVDLCVDEDVSVEQSQEELLGAGAEVNSEALIPPPDVSQHRLPETLKVAVLQLKDLLENPSEWDQSPSDVVQVLNDCDPVQVEVVCGVLALPNLPEHVLPKLCSSVLELSPDLSFSAATAFIKSLLLEKVLFLTEPASRCLVTTVTSLCSRYPRPMCHALFEHVLEDTNIGNLQADLLNKLINASLDSHYKLVILQMTFKVHWNEAMLSVIHCLLDSKLDLSEDLFTQFTNQLMKEAPQFTKSVKFAKMMLTVLTKYNSIVTAAHKHPLSTCLMLNETFLKKSLQAALKRIMPS